VSDPTSAYQYIKFLRIATDNSELLKAAEKYRQAIGELLFNSKISHVQHAKLYTHLYETWIRKRIEIEQKMSS